MDDEGSYIRFGDDRCPQWIVNHGVSHVSSCRTTFFVCYTPSLQIREQQSSAKDAIV